MAGMVARISPKGSEQDLGELRQRVMLLLGLFFAIVGAVGSLAFLPGPVFHWREFVVFVSVLGIGLAVWRTRERHPRRAQMVILVGPTFSLTLALLLTNSPAVPFFAALMPIANSLLSPHRGLVAAALSTMPLCALRPSDPTLVPSLAVLWSVAAMEYISSRGLYTVLEWAWSSQQQASKLLQALRVRQGELNRVLKALDEAYDSLKRSNDELIIARRQAEEARVFKEQFVANVSHELRTPLNLIVGFAEMLYLVPETYESVGWTPDLVSDLKELYRASRHLQSLVNDILDLSRIDAARLPMFREFADLRNIISEAVDTATPLFRQRGLAINVECPETLPQLLVDRTRIRQVLLNLLNNAVRFTDKGTVAVRVEQTEEAILVGVHDTGIGIPEHHLEHIFDRFSGADTGPRGRGGAGLGLALCRQFVQLHGGRTWAASRVGVGSSFFFSLPLPGALPQSAPLRRIPDRREAELSRAPVVVVEPDPSIADMLSRYLGDRPVLSARDEGEAEAMILSEHPVAVIVNCPAEAPVESWLGDIGEISGRYAVPVVRCSIPSASWLTRSCHLDDCVTKPVSRDVLGGVLAKYCPQPATVLVVDDDPGFVRLIARMLGSLRHEGQVVTAYSGGQALRLARENPPQLVLLDLLMPEMSGFDVLAELRRDPALRDAAVVAVTATSYADDVTREFPGRFTITQSQGITTGRLTELLSAATRIVQPNYVAGESAASRA